MSVKSFLLEKKLKALKKIGRFDYQADVHSYLNQVKHGLDEDQQGLIIREVLESQDGINPVIAILNSNFDRNVLDAHFPEMKERIEVLSPDDMVEALQKIPSFYKGFPKRETAAQAMLLLEQNLQKVDAVKAFNIIDTMLREGTETESAILGKVKECNSAFIRSIGEEDPAWVNEKAREVGDVFYRLKAEFYAVSDKFKELHKASVSRLLKEGTEAGFEHVFGVFAPVGSLESFPISKKVSPHDIDHLQDLAENVVFPVVKDDTETAVYFQMLLERAGVVVQDSQEKFAETAKGLRKAWDEAVQIAMAKKAVLMLEVNKVEGEINAAEYCTTKSALEGFFVKAARNVEENGPVTQDLKEGVTFKCCLPKQQI